MTRDHGSDSPAGWVLPVSGGLLKTLFADQTMDTERDYPLSALGGTGTATG